MTDLENALAREKQIMTSLEIAHKTIRGLERENARYRALLKKALAANRGIGAPVGSVMDEISRELE